MAGVAGADLTNAVSQAGGFGILGGGYGDKKFFEQQLSQVNRDLPFGVGFITWRLQDNPNILDLALDAQPKAILLSFGELQPYVKKIKDHGVLLLAQCQTVSDAEHAAALGADAIIAQGTEAGGHGSVRATMSLLPAVVDSLPNHPVIGAGGIADGRGLAACFNLGAIGVMMGSRFYAAQESLAAEAAKLRAVAAIGDNTTRSSVFDVLRNFDWPKPYNLRTLKNTLSDQYEANIPALLNDKAAAQAKFNQACDDGDFDQAPVIIGEAVDLIHDIPTAAQIVRRVSSEAEQVIRTTHELLQS